MKKSLLFILLLAGFTALNAQVVKVTFRANMSVKMKQGQFDPAKDKITVAGNFQGWNATATQLTRLTAPNDSIYAYTYDSAKVGDTLNFKFVLNGSTWEDDPNRQIIVPAGGTTFTAFFNRDSVFKPVGNGSIIFRVDMSVMKEVGIFDPTKDSVSVRGSFNGWGDNDKARAFMQKDALNPIKWFLNVPFVNAELNGRQDYKYFMRFGAGHTDSILTEDNRYERPIVTGGGNRGILFQGKQDQDAGIGYYDGINPDWVIAAGKTAAITFRVNMAPAMDVKKQPIPFNPATDKVFWVCGEPAFQRTQGWKVQDTNRVVQLLPQKAGDSIYVGTMTVKGPSWNGFVYRYGFVGADNKTWTYEPSGYANFAYRVRFIKQTAARTFVQPYTAPVDTWTNAEVKTDQETTPLTSVERTAAVAMTYTLDQNYPNPFNPSTVITFSVPEKSNVTLKVFDILGREVATLLNGEMNTGKYEVKFDASKLTSGVYLYTIQAGNFSQSKKMMLVK
ncbi:MAG: T9SS type A sorting domain-containing protein [Bacillota bacterium]